MKFIDWVEQSHMKRWLHGDHQGPRMKALLLAIAAATLLYIGVLWISPACALDCWSQVITTGDGRYVTCTTCCDFGACNTTCF